MVVRIMRSVVLTAVLSFVDSFAIQPLVLSRQACSSLAVALLAKEWRNEQGETELIVAAEAGDEDRVRALLADGADVNAVSYSGWTAMHGAAECGSVAILSELVSSGAKVSAEALSGKTPLDIALQYGRPDAAEKLRAFGARAPIVQSAKGQRAGLPKMLAPKPKKPIRNKGASNAKSRGQDIYLRSAPFIYYGAYVAFFGKMVLVLIERVAGS